MHQIRFGRRVQRFDVFFTDNGLNGTDETRPVSRMLKDRTDHIGRGRLALGSGNADHRDLFGRIAEPGCRNHGQPVPRVLNLQNADIGREFPVCGQPSLFNKDGGRSLLYSLCYKTVAVKRCSGNAHKQAAFRNLSRIIDNRCHIRFRIPLQNANLQALHQLTNLHLLTLSGQNI